MEPTNPGSMFGSLDRRISRRRLFEVGGATIGVTAFLAACSSESAAEPGRVGEAPVPTDLPNVDVDDAVLLRTMESLEYAILDVYAVLAALDGLTEGTAATLTRFTEDHTATAGALGALTTDVGGEPYACANPWLMERQFQPALDHIVGVPAEGDTAAIPPTDDPNRDTLAMLNGLETLASATYQQMVEKLSTPPLRAAVIVFGAQAARRAAVVAVQTGGATRFVSPALLGGEVAPDDEGFTAVYAIPSRFGQIIPVDVTVGVENDQGLRYTAMFETPADNAYRYEGETCPA